MGTATFIIIAIATVIVIGLGLVVIMANNKSRKPSPPITLDEALANQTKVINNYMSFDPGLKDIFKEAIRDGVTHIQHAPQDDTILFTRDDTIAFYRIRDGVYEKRFLFLHERIGSKDAKWELNWRKCEELPREAIPIPKVD